MYPKMRGLSFAILLSFSAYTQTVDSLLSYLKNADPLLNQVLSDSTYRVQFIFTALGEKNQTLDYSNDLYFYPASTVKLPVAVVAMEKMQRLGLELDDRLVLNDNVHCGNRLFVRRTQNEFLTFRKLLRELIVISDNDFYNILYHFVTPGELNVRLNELGFASTKIFRAFTSCEMEEHLHTNSLSVKRGDSVLYIQEETILSAEILEEQYTFSEQRLFGSQHERDKKIVDGAFDLNYHLEIPLVDLHEMLLRLFRPVDFPQKMRWILRADFRDFLKDILLMFPGELDDPRLKNPEYYPDNLYKYAVHGEEVKEDFEVYGKLGLSYGFTTEVSYIYDKINKKEYLLSVSLYTNQNDTVNDGIYEYETIARPFISRLSLYLIANFK